MAVGNPAMMIVSYGMGNDSTRALIEMVKRGIEPPFAILSADTAGEKPHTYEFRELFSKWLVEHGYPSITVVYPRNRRKERVTLEGELLRTKRIPSVAFGFKTCSQRFKVRPQERWIEAQPECRAVWARGEKIIKVIGYNASEWTRAKLYEQERYENWYPLIEWGIKKEDVAQGILDAGLPLPGKSACFYCPNSTKPEIDDLATRYPDLLDRALHLEAQGHWKSRTIKGLGRRFSWARYVNGEPVDDNPHDDQQCDCYDGEFSALTVPTNRIIPYTNIQPSGDPDVKIEIELKIGLSPELSGFLERFLGADEAPSKQRVHAPAPDPQPEPEETMHAAAARGDAAENLQPPAKRRGRPPKSEQAQTPASLSSDNRSSMASTSSGSPADQTDAGEGESLAEALGIEEQSNGAYTPKDVVDALQAAVERTKDIAGNVKLIQDTLNEKIGMKGVGSDGSKVPAELRATAIQALNALGS